MTALSLQSKSLLATEPDAVDGRVWVPLREAAQRLGKNVGHLRRVALAKLKPEGYAMVADGKWYIARNLDRRLDDDVDDDRIDVEEIERFSRGEQRKAAMMKMAAVRQFRRLREHGQGKIAVTLPKLLDDLARKFPAITGTKTGRISRTTIYKWDKLYNGDDEDSIIALMDTRGGSRAPGGDENAWHYFTSIFCDQRKPSIKTCWARTRDQAAEFGWQWWCSESSARRQLERRVPPAIQAKHRDPKRYRDSYRPYIEQSPERFAPGRVWTSDHAQMDFWVMMGGRPVRLFVTAWQDIGTRKIIGWELSPEPSSATILAAFRSAMLDDANKGGPSMALTDNGRDYSAAQWSGKSKIDRQRKVLKKGYIDETFFTGIFGMLDIDLHFTLPYSPQSKGTIAGDLKMNRSHVRKVMKRARAHEKAQRLIDANPELRYLSKYELLADTALEEESQSRRAAQSDELRAAPTPMDSAVDGTGASPDIDQDDSEEKDIKPQRARLDILDFTDAYKPIASPGLVKPDTEEDIWERTRRAIQ